ncbi:unnamed protein product [Mytilus coruscus]|uniref:Uncharacterized protein n=1 Tax=Mytilus coruscus TaxID=42192 RepID=A0A6J8A171_MYTCO|nr:unnamed protein product [Mytilus coruscus]
MSDEIDDNIEDRSGTVVVDVFEGEIDIKKGTISESLSRMNLFFYFHDILTEFQKETLTYWACKLEKFVKTRAADVIYNHTKTQNVILIEGPTGIDLQLVKEERWDICKSYISTDVARTLNEEGIMMKNGVKFLEYIKQNITLNELTKTQEGMTALHVVAALGYHEYVSFFKHDTRMINERDAAGNIPLHLACKNGHLKIVNDLVKNKSFVYISNNDELKPFFHACENGFVDVAKYMLHNSSKWIKVNEKYRTKNKRCVLHVVCANGHAHIAVLLLRNNAAVDVKDADGCTPLHLACYKGSSEIVSALLNCNANVNANGAKVNNKKPSVVPLHEAFKAGNESILEILIQAKASVNHRKKEGETPIDEACENGHDNVVKILVDNKAVVNEKDNHSNKNIVMTLVVYKVYVNAQDKCGQTPLFKSSVNRCIDIVEYLLNHASSVKTCGIGCISPLAVARKWALHHS